MLFNMVSGISYGLETVSGSFSGISAPRVLTVSKTVEPLLLAIKTTVGSSTELIAYYRRKPDRRQHVARHLPAARRIRNKAAADGTQRERGKYGEC